MQLVTRSKWISCMFRVVAGPAAVAAHVEMCRAGLRSGGGRRGGGTMASDKLMHKFLLLNVVPGAASPAEFLLLHKALQLCAKTDMCRT